MPGHHIELPPGYGSVRDYIDGLVAFLQSYQHLWQFHAVDFFTNDYWSSGHFPKEWHLLKEDASVTYDHLLALAANGTVKEDWPESLKEFVALSKSIALPRDPSREPIAKELERTVAYLDNKVTYGMTPKKKHEVQLLAHLINNLAVESKSSCIMDLGAGQGYLDAVLAYTYCHTVIGVDDDEIQTCGAKRRSGMIEKIFSKPKNKDKAIGKVYHVNRRVTAEEKFNELLSEVKSQAGVAEEERVIEEESKRWLLCGLHACGDLSAALVRHFLMSDARVLVSVGCCYNHLTEEGPDPCIPPKYQLPDSPPPRRRPAPPSPLCETGERGLIVTHSAGFPLSKYVWSQGVSLGFTARMLACQATCRWTQQGDAAKESFSRHFYRALLQLIILEKELIPDLDDSRNIVIGRLARGAFGNGFIGYARHALRKLGIDLDKAGLTDDVLREYEEKYRDREKEVAVVWTLRAMVAEAIESLILVDRFLSIVEMTGERDVYVDAKSRNLMEAEGDGQRYNGEYDNATCQSPMHLSVMLFPLFDHVDSPRNMVLVAKKIR
ncbi:uncharacterized protein SPPG_00514 [Spizellomyces punctatus DAOM BR117]|uniref:Methyltransferase domain-containing protein n=1 Tax=Spizellomyces punctatus (strain DAOM BR117) TaxID=645134 RepID=A0A0L0HTY7_SPIPD|nr:uncharacterized protein SPPG_00514 [Spizellomyces punctatus DAOM BR117]KND04811.1 hypothetical protein SPPG_00514 [Spizellomyces punctatus DAOM BR117]|eukprot:XP_016612850.1 hypothetical protein SPPG_00514 [Spizellomyces punctatus DAOM BR117]